MIRRGSGSAGVRAILAAVGLVAVLAQARQAQAQTPQPTARELVVGTKVTPPFAMKAEDGTWHGISIDLWRRIADQLHLRYRFQETTLSGLTEGVADGALDASVAALTVTEPCHRLVDFTQPFYSTGLSRFASSQPDAVPDSAAPPMPGSRLTLASFPEPMCSRASRFHSYQPCRAGMMGSLAETIR